MKTRLALAAAAALVLAGAQAQAKPVTIEDASQFSVGTATADDVIAKLGKPNSDERDATGKRTIRYTSMHAHPKAASFVPVVGLFAGGAKGSSATVSFEFGKDGKLVNYTSQTTNIDCGAVITGANCGR
jgi:opacity protein-like surface antigen